MASLILSSAGGLQAQVLLDMDKDPEGIKVLAHYGSLRFIEAKSSDFIPVRNMAKRAGLKIKDLKYEY